MKLLHYSFKFMIIVVCLAGARFEVFDGLYNQEQFYNPVRYDYSLSHLGGSSYQNYGEAYSTITGELLSKDYIFNVCIDVKTRRPAPLPDIARLKCFQHPLAESLTWSSL